MSDVFSASAQEADTHRATGAAVVGDLPTPRFRIGQTAFYPDTTKVVEQLDCPDCLGAKTWRLEMPSGDTHDVPCQRCCGGMTYSRVDDLPTLNYEVYQPVVGQFLIANVEVRAKGHWNGKGPEVKYGNAGSQWREEDALYGDEETALTLAKLKAAEMNVKSEAKAERIHQRNIGALKLEDARFDQFKNGLWNAWYAYRDLTGKLEEHLDRDDGRSASDTLEDLRSDVRWDIQYHQKQDRPLDILVEAVEAALTGDASKLAPAYQTLPEALRSKSTAGDDELGGDDGFSAVVNPENPLSDKLGGAA